MTEDIKPKLTLKLGGDKLKAVIDKLKIDAPKATKVKNEVMPIAEYKEILNLVRRKFSKAFPRAADSIKMLKIGIHENISKKLNVEEGTIYKFLYVYTRKKKYKLNLKIGAPRYDLKGNITSYVLQEEVSKPPKKKKQT